MYCKYCGKLTSEGDVFCKNCGERIRENKIVSETTTYADFASRLAAYLIDGVVIYMISFTFGLAFALILGLLQLGGLADTVSMNFFFDTLGIIVTWLYFSIMESSSKQATLGKMALKLKVTDLEGNRITFGRATGRYFAKILSCMILFIGYFMVLFTEKKQALHDIIAGTLVIKEP